MKYYCIANPMPLVKLAYSTSFWDNIRTPMFGLLPITEAKMLKAFNESNELIFCKSFDDANQLRYSKITLNNPNVAPEFNKNAIAKGYPLGDYAIYEVDVDQDITEQFVSLNELPIDHLKKFISQELYFNLLIDVNRRSAIPNIAICPANKSDLTISLISCQYIPIPTQDDLDKSSACVIS